MPGRRRPAPHTGKSPAAHTWPQPPRVSSYSVDIHRGMHRHCWFGRCGSRGPNSRWWIAPVDFRLRIAAACFERPPAGRHALDVPVWRRIRESRYLMAAVGAYARPLARRSRKAAAAIPRIDFRLRVLVVRISSLLLAVW